MEGKEMCSLSKEEFLERTPPFMGDILWEHLEIMQRGEPRTPSRRLSSSHDTRAECQDPVPWKAADASSGKPLSLSFPLPFSEIIIVIQN